LARLRKQGLAPKPIEIEGRQIARTFWGKAWCKNLESYSDYANRLPRGRTYVRHGAVLHLEAREGRVAAMVDGSHVYNVVLEIETLAPKRWRAIRAATSGEIDSLIELLEGHLSRSVMELVTRPDSGLFPAPKEIHLSCSCPDRARMCKHVAAVLYAVGAKLDHDPELLFTLRGVDPNELISSALEHGLTQATSTRSLASAELSAIFGPDIDFSTDPLDKPAAPRTKRRSRKRSTPAPRPPATDSPLDQRATQLLALIAEHPGERTPALAKRLGASLSTTRNTLAALRRTQAIRFEGAPRTGGYFPT
jgi:uncharacterized Zn finger protein